MTGRDDKPGPPSSLGHVPAATWEFDESVTRVFDDMLQRSIPQYQVMRKAVFDIGRHFAAPGTDIVDLGCSRGDALAPFVETFGADCRYHGMEVSEPMLAAVRERFADEIGTGLVKIERHDLRDGYPEVRASVTLCVLTLQFLPLDHRQRVLRDVFRCTAPGGALILVEKVLGADAGFDELMVGLYHAFKAERGYSKEEVERKRLALEGVLVPVTAHANEELMRGAGFAQVDCFWRWMNFAGWVARA